MANAKHVARLLPPEGSPQYLREALGLERKEWARILGVAGMTVHRWENGTPPTGLASEVMRGITRAIETGMDPHAIRERINLGIGAFIALSLTTKTGKRP